MLKNTPSAAIAHFKGKLRRPRLIEALQHQSLVHSNPVLAEEIADVAVLEEYTPDTELIRQGDYDRDVFLVLTGKVVIKVNNRVVAERFAGFHVGEMSALDPTAQRSATVMAQEPTVVARIPQARFDALAKKHPELWRVVANELAKRLRERDRFHRAPHSVPIVFLGSSKEGLEIAEAIHNCLRSVECVIRLWNRDVFAPGATFIESLLQQTCDADFAILVLSPDDVTRYRQKSYRAPRDNVVFELGLFMGALGRDRAFMVKPAGNTLKIPSDLFGVTCLEFALGPKGLSLRKRLSPACRRLKQVITTKGPR